MDEKKCKIEVEILDTKYGEPDILIVRTPIRKYYFSEDVGNQRFLTFHVHKSIVSNNHGG